MKKQFAVLGLGRFGSKVARELFYRDQDVVVIDRDELKIEAIKDEVTHAFIGDITNEETLKEAGVNNCDVAVIAEIMADYPDTPLLIDPVLSSGRGDELATDEVQAARIDLLFPQATLITPNSIEARRLAFYNDDSDEAENASLEESARRLLDIGCEYVLVTGTHERSHEVINTLYGESGLIKAYNWERLPGSYHGSGCTLTSAIAACIAHGLSMEEAVLEAQEYTWQTLKAGFRPGMGQYIPDRMFWARDDKEE